jgi:hypothetical protein
MGGELEELVDITLLRRQAAMLPSPPLRGVKRPRGTKSEIRNPKFEIRPKSEIRNQRGERAARVASGEGQLLSGDEFAVLMRGNSEEVSWSLQQGHVVSLCCSRQGRRRRDHLFA